VDAVATGWALSYRRLSLTFNYHRLVMLSVFFNPEQKMDVLQV